jgi:hypothetical protein
MEGCIGKLMDTIDLNTLKTIFINIFMDNFMGDNT